MIDTEKLRYALRLALYRRSRRLSYMGHPAEDWEVKAHFDNGMRVVSNPDHYMQRQCEMSEEFQNALTDADSLIDDLVREYNS